MSDRPTISGSLEDEAKRREFLKKCGRFVIVTPPAMTLLLSVASMPEEAHASTIGHHPPHPRPRGGDDQGGDDNSQD